MAAAFSLLAIKPEIVSLIVNVRHALRGDLYKSDLTVTFM